jgi:hypothetical protein
MVDTRRLFKEYCPLVEEFNVRNILGGYEQKEWMFSSRQTIPNDLVTVTWTKDLTLSTLTGGLVTKLDHYEVLVQKLNFVPINIPFITNKTTEGFTLNGDSCADWTNPFGAGADYSIVILGSQIPRGGDSPNITPAQQRGLDGRWAMDYCPYCKAYKVKTLVGGVLKDVTAFSFLHTTGGQMAGSEPVVFRTDTHTEWLGTAPPLDTKSRDIGLSKQALITQMEDATLYDIIITKHTAAPEVAQVAWPSAITKTGFTLNGEAGKTYSILIIGQILY